MIIFTTTLAEVAQRRRTSIWNQVFKIIITLFSFFLTVLFLVFWLYWNLVKVIFEVQFSCLVVSDYLQPHGTQDARLPCPSPTPRAYAVRLVSIKSVMPSNHLILCRPLLLTPSILPSIRVFSDESVLHIRWPKDWNCASASVLPMNWFPLGLTSWIFLQSMGPSRVFSNNTVQKHQFFSAQLSL